MDSGLAMKLDLGHPGWRDYAASLQQLGFRAGVPQRPPAVADLNRLLDQYPSQQAGKAIRFVAAGQLPAISYEEHIFDTGEISTRENNWHDVFNALVWMRFPRIKSAINARHWAEIRSGHTRERGLVRDALTLFDECGVIVVGSHQPAVKALAERNWQQLFGEHRSAWQTDIRVFVPGHALLEKFLQPYKAITAQVLVFRCEAAFLQQDDDAQAGQVDRLLAQQIGEARVLNASAELSPLPLMGIPGWWPSGSQDEAFYADSRVFRAPPEDFRPVGIHPLEQA